MTTRTDAETARILAAFEAAGATRVELPILQPAEALLDLYGEDIRARAYTTRDPLIGEQMLRPDFTVPVVQMHLRNGAASARYAYSGKVFRVQDGNTDRPSEYDQVGYEIFGHDDRADADAEVFALFSRTLAFLPLRVATGDIGILMAAVRGLNTSDRRKAALMRHLWRPGRFKRLLDMFAGRIEVPAHRTHVAEAGAKLMDGAGPLVGLRSSEEIELRIRALQDDAQVPPIAREEAAAIDHVLGLREKLPAAVSQLNRIAEKMPKMADAVDRLAARADALKLRGVDVEGLDFEGSYGRTSMEYYDGFVFGFYAATGPETPPVATGGRYDALTRAMGGDVPAIGGMIRPALSAGLVR